MRGSIEPGLLKVGAELLKHPDARHHSRPLGKASGVRPAVLYRILDRLLEAGWVTDGWEDAESTVDRRPPRRYYVLTAEGREMLRALIAVTPQP